MTLTDLPPSATPRPGSILGTRVLRTEDPGLLTGSRRYLADLPYWRARAEEGVGTKPAAKADYDAFIALRPAPSPDPLAADARTRRDAIK